jgi:putative membrane protein
MSSTFLPTLNAGLNLTSFILLISGFIAIKRGKEELHKRCMFAALTSSAVFLVSYLIYHYQFGSRSFPGTGPVKALYLTILLTHTVLATGMLPLIFLTFKHALTDNREKHKKLARITFPIWSYVSFTGVVIYVFLYLLY